MSVGATLVVIPARNEVATIARVVRDVRDSLDLPVLVVDDHSSDATGQLAREAGARVLRLAHPLGAWGATQTGLRYAHELGFEAAISMDGDGQHRAADCPALLAMLGEANVVIGSCPRRLSRARLLAWQYFRLLTRLPVQDFTSGLRAYDARALEVLSSENASLLDFQDVGVLVLLRRAGLRIREVPVQMLERKNGCSRVFGSWWVVGKYMALTTVLCLSRIEYRRARS